MFRKLINEYSESFQMAYIQMKSAKVKSFLTALGVIIGILAVTLMGTAINAVDKGFEKSMEMIGYDILYVNKFSWTQKKEWWRYRNRRNIEMEYANQLNELIQGEGEKSELVLATPNIGNLGNIKYDTKELKAVYVSGVTVDYTNVYNVNIKEGRFFSEIEDRGARRVCLLGYDIDEILFPNGNAVGNAIMINGMQYQIIGKLERQGSFLGLFSWDRMVMVPIKSLSQQFDRKKDFQTGRTTVMVKAKDKNRLAQAKDELEMLVRRIRGLRPEQPKDFDIDEQEAFRSTIDPIKNGIALAGIFITGLSLFVGAIGIMNITFVSVKERTKEIGTRKAIGAKRRAILTQFLIEAVFICMVGGLIGVGISYGIFIALLEFFPTTPLEFSPSLIVSGMLASMVTGIIAGFAPAFQASKLDPIEALRYQ